MLCPEEPPSKQKAQMPIRVKIQTTHKKKKKKFKKQ